MQANPLLQYFENNDRRLIHKWVHYFEIYHRHFSRFQDQHPTVIEFGVSHGGSLQMWRDYFGEGAQIYGVDINPKCKRVEEEGITVLIGDQEDRSFLREVITTVGPVDVLIDDGGHTMLQQIATFEEMYSTVVETGVYVVEDLHTSYWDRFGGGVKRDGTFAEYSKNFIDFLHAWHAENNSIEVSDFTRSTYSLTYYDSVLVIEKGRIEEPHRRKTGQKSF